MKFKNKKETHCEVTTTRNKVNLYDKVKKVVRLKKKSHLGSVQSHCELYKLMSQDKIIHLADIKSHCKMKKVT